MKVFVTNLEQYFGLFQVVGCFFNWGCGLVATTAAAAATAAKRNAVLEAQLGRNSIQLHVQVQLRQLIVHQVRLLLAKGVTKK